MKKGSKVYVEGALQTRRYTDQSGQERFTTEVVLGAFRGELVLLDAKGEGMGGSSSVSSDANNSSSGWDATGLGSSNDSFDDEIPF